MNTDSVIGSWWTPNELIQREIANFERLKAEWDGETIPPPRGIPNKFRQNRRESHVTRRPSRRAGRDINA